ncbi:MAG: HNH endonuclease [Tepidisphaerales bacterium]
MDVALAGLVRRRAGDTCEYCRMPQRYYRTRHQIDHIVSQQHGGPTSADNLALACLHCNLHKGPNLSGIDPITGSIVRLFNPRQDSWPDHFRWQRALIEGLTPQGRATIAVLAMNDPDLVETREILLTEGGFPPVEPKH